MKKLEETIARRVDELRRLEKKIDVVSWEESIPDQIGPDELGQNKRGSGQVLEYISGIEESKLPFRLLRHFLTSSTGTPKEALADGIVADGNDVGEKDVSEKRMKEGLASEKAASFFYASSSSPIEAAAPVEGTVLDGRFRIDELVDAGKTGRLFHGTDLETSNAVTGLLVPSTLAEDLPEAGATGSTGHVASTENSDPFLRPYYNGSLSDGGQFLIAHAFKGATLARALELSGQFSRKSPGPFLLALKKLTRRLADAHRNGIAHRNLTAEHVVIEASGEIQVMDWRLGCQRVEDGANGPGDSCTDDIRAVGALFYKVLTGRAPDGISPDAELDDASLLSSQLAPPHDLNTVILRCLARDPAARYADAGELFEDLEDLL